jgi:hypothetical protein
VGSRFHDWIYWMALLQLQLIITVHILNSCLTTSTGESLWSLNLGLVCSLSNSVRVQSESELLYDWLFTANQFVLEPSPLTLTDTVHFLLTRGRVCRLQLLLALAIAFILGSESRGTRNHILLSQIRDLPFCRLLLLAGLRWRYSTPPPHGKVSRILDPYFLHNC